MFHIFTTVADGNPGLTPPQRSPAPEPSVPRNFNSSFNNNIPKNVTNLKE